MQHMSVVALKRGKRLGELIKHWSTNQTCCSGQMCRAIMSKSKKYKVSRYVSAYERSGDALVDSRPMKKDEFEKIRKWLRYTADEPMCDCYLLKGEVLEKVFNKLGSRLIRGNYEYFLEAEVHGLTPFLSN